MDELRIRHTKFGTGTIETIEQGIAAISFDQGGVRKIDLKFAVDHDLITFKSRHVQQLVDALASTPVSGEQRQLNGSSLNLGEANSIYKNSNFQNITESKDPSISSLKVGSVYKNSEIVKVFQISTQGGMRRSRRKNALVLFAMHSASPEQNPYEDRWQEDGFFHYSGMGLIGDQSLEDRQNRTLSESPSNGVNIYLFESQKKAEYIYQGEVYLAGLPYAIQERDTAGRMRRVYKFPLAIRKWV